MQYSGYKCKLSSHLQSPNSTCGKHVMLAASLSLFPLPYNWNKGIQFLIYFQD